MFRFVSHINYLLTIHGCVVVPHTGGFVIHTVSAGYDEKRHAFSPPHTEVLFNPSLTHDDGLLANSYMRSYGVGFEKARLMVERDVAEAKVSLGKYGKADLGAIGSFSLGESGQLVFSASPAGSFEANSYGLAPFSLSAIPAIISIDEDITPSKTGQKNADIFYLPVSRRLIRIAAISAAAVALFLLLSTPVKDVNTSVFTASIIPTSEITTPAPVTAESTQPEVSGMNSALPEHAPAGEEVVAEPVADIVQPAIKVKKYYIVIGSFPNEPKANLFITGINPELFPDAGIVERDDRHRVYAYVYNNREEAEAQLASVRRIDNYENAWLFISR